jgi:predicted amidohydrolase
VNDIIKVAAVQMNPKLMKNDKNLETILLRIREAAAEGSVLVVFPECTLTGYRFNSREEAIAHSETIPGPATNRVANLCKELGVYVIFGMLETDGDRLFNAAVFVGPDGIVGSYRKTHIPPVAVDRFVDPGDRSFQVYRTSVGNIGISPFRNLPVF